MCYQIEFQQKFSLTRLAKSRHPVKNSILYHCLFTSFDARVMCSIMPLILLFYIIYATDWQHKQTRNTIEYNKTSTFTPVPLFFVFPCCIASDIKSVAVSAFQLSIQMASYDTTKQQAIKGNVLPWEGLLLGKAIRDLPKCWGLTQVSLAEHISVYFSLSPCSPGSPPPPDPLRHHLPPSCTPPTLQHTADNVTQHTATRAPHLTPRSKQYPPLCPFPLPSAA